MSATKLQQEEINSFRTQCCKAEPYHKSRKKYVCIECGEDITKEFTAFMDAVLNDPEFKEPTT